MLTVPKSDHHPSTDPDPPGKRSGTTLRRAASDVSRSSQYKTTALIQLQKSPAEAKDSLKNADALKAFHTARLQTTLEFFRKRDELNNCGEPTSLSRGRPLSLHTSFCGHHSNHMNTGSPYQNGTTPANFGNIIQRSTERKPHENRQSLASTDDKTATEKMSRSSSQLERMDDFRGTTSCKSATRFSGARTGVTPEASVKGHTNSVRDHILKETAAAANEGLPTLEKLKEDIEAYDKELHECDNYDQRRAFRAKIRDLRKQIKEEKYCKLEQTSLPSYGDPQQSTSMSLPRNNVTGTVQLSEAVTPVRAHPVIIEESVSTDRANNVNDISDKNMSRKLNADAREQHSSDKERCKKKDMRVKGSIPEVVRELMDQTVLDGQPCYFECNISAPDGATIVWYHDSKLLESSDEIKQHFADGSATLDIAEVFPDDEGVYKCVVSCTSGTAETAAKLTVLGENDLEVPDIRVPLENQKYEEGDTIILRCGVCGKPQPTITWSRDGYPLLGAKRYIYSFDGKEAILTINDAIVGDGGSYTCEVRNPAGMCSSECIVDVKASPLKQPEFLTVLSRAYSLKEGSNLTLTCHVTGKPRPQVTWYHGSRAVSLSDKYDMEYCGDCVKLTLKNATSDMAGTYTCIASNSSGNIRSITTINVTGKTIEPGKPVFTVPLSDMTAIEGTQTFVLECHIRGLPRPVVLWQKGRDFLHSGSRYKETFDGEVATLQLRQVNKGDADLYTCMCRNEFGKVKTTCMLTVKDSEGTLSTAARMSGKPDINSINDEDELYKLMNATDDFEERKKIRARMREIREAKAAEFERRRKEREESQEDAVKLRLRLAEEQKRKKMEEFEKQAREGKKDVGIVEQALKAKLAAAEAEKKKKIEMITEVGKAMTQVYHAGSDLLKNAEEKHLQQQELNEEGVSRTTKTEKSSDGGTTVTSTTLTTHRTKDGSSTTIKQTKQVTQTSGIGGTSYAISKTSAASKPTGPRGARAAFQQMDKATAPPGGAKPNFLGGGGGRVAVQRSPSTIKQMLLDWCKSVTKEYEPKVTITNFSSSWNNGLAFCALIHHFYPDAFNFDELDPKKRRYNFTLAFDTAEKLADIAPLLDVEDMVRMKNPDWKCVFTYVQSFYRRFRSSPSTPTTPVTPVSPEPQTN